MQAVNLPAEETVNGVKIYRCWGPSLGGASMGARLIDMISFCFLGVLRAMFSPRADVVVLLTNPPFFPVTGCLLKKLKGERFVHVIMDVYPEVAVQSGTIKNGSMLLQFLKWVSQATLRSADAVVVLGEDMKDAIVRSGAPSEKVKIIRNWADPEVIYPVDPAENHLRKSWGLDGKYVVEYSGNLGVSHSFEDILAVAEELADHDDIRFLFIGGGVRYKEVERTASSKGLGNVLMKPYQDVSYLSHSLSVGDVHYISLRNGFEGLVVPSKVYGIMAAGRPMIYQGDQGGEIAQMIARERCGIVVAEGDRAGLRDGILRLYRDREMAGRMGTLARTALEEKYSASIGLAEYRKVLVPAV